MISSTFVYGSSLIGIVSIIFILLHLLTYVCSFTKEISSKICKDVKGYTRYRIVEYNKGFAIKILYCNNIWLLLLDKQRKPYVFMDIKEANETLRIIKKGI